MKKEDSIKEEGGNESGDWKLKRESTVAIKIVSVTFFSWFIEKLTFSDYDENEFI